MTDDWTGDMFGFNRIHGLAPWEYEVDPYPGMDSITTGAYSSTDTLIYP